MDDPEQALIQEIIQNPSSDTARLVYADWLDDRGDPRGEFIRAELSFADAKSMREASLGREFFNTKHSLNLDPNWIAKVALKFDLHIHDVNNNPSGVFRWVRSQQASLRGLDLNEPFMMLPDAITICLELDLISICVAYHSAFQQINRDNGYVYQPPQVGLTIVRSDTPAKS